MDVVFLLPDSVANQIAAGEVIQRPASVIKELVENAVDAGAKTINVIIVDAGRTLIQVIDDGKGMSPTDARMAFERHATSKIKQAADLFDLHTMGFRGEALASIAAVAQVQLETRMATEELGSQICISGSKVTSQQPVSCPVGSNFRVENLFFNVPARRKFLKTNATEFSNILTAFERIVLVYPDIHFTLHNNGAETLNLRAGSLRQRICDVFGKSYSQDLLPVEADTRICRVSGLVGKPETAKKKGGRDYFFVNGRYMKHPYFHKAVLTAYNRLIPDGTQVPYFLYFDVNPNDIDVNIHPTKTEIKFENEQAIFQIVLAAVRDAIGKFCEIPSIDFDTEGRPDIPLFDPAADPATQPLNPPQPHYNPSYNPFATSPSGSSSGSSSSRRPVNGGNSAVPSSWTALYPTPDSSDFPESPEAALPFSIDDTDVLVPSPSAAATSSPTLSSFLSDKSPIHYQYKGRYIMTAVKSGLMVIDQHRASLRILFERYESPAKDSANSSSPDSPKSPSIPSFRLLFPESIQFSPSEAAAITPLLPDLTRLGFDLSDLGGNTFAINGIPADLTGTNPVSLLQQLVADITEHDGLTGSTAPRTILHAALAASAAIPYGQILSNEEMESLVNALFACENVNYTPDGKAILHIFPQTDIDRVFA